MSRIRPLPEPLRIGVGEMSPVQLAVTLVVFGLRASALAATPLCPEEVAAHIGEKATVCGVVASAEYGANEQGQPTLLDLGKPHPNAMFTAVI